jgi:DNA-binding PucR family transcriptional regulator
MPTGFVRNRRAYDHESSYDAVIRRDPEAAVIVQPRSAAPLSETVKIETTQHDRDLQGFAGKGRMGCQKASGYNIRSWVEGAVACYEQMVGDELGFRKDARRVTDVAVAVLALSRMSELGRLLSVRIR